jgi:recombination protein RecA
MLNVQWPPTRNTINCNFSFTRCRMAKTTDPETARQEALDRTVKQLEKEYGKGTIQTLGDSSTRLGVAAIPTGSLALDIALGVGGVPRGRVVEVYGPEASGKTTLALQIVANAQKSGGIAAFVDAEHALDPDYAQLLGVDMENLLIHQPDSAEQALDVVEALVRSNALDIVVVDSVAALVPREEVEGEMGDQTVGLQARLMSRALRKLTSAISKSRTTVLFINQIRMKIGVMFGSPETTPGGRALKFYSAVRIEIRRSGSIKEGDETIGHRCRIKVAKNKVAPPFKRCEVDLLFRCGISREGDILELGEECGIIERSGSWYSYGDTKLGQGKENCRKFLEENPGMADEIEAKIIAEKAPALAEKRKRAEDAESSE